MSNSSVRELYCSTLRTSKLVRGFSCKSTGTLQMYPLWLVNGTLKQSKTPPDLSAMSLWVDLINVPGYLYSLGISSSSTQIQSDVKDGRGKSIGGGEPNETTSTEDLLHGQRPKTCHCLGKIHVAPSMLHHLQWMGTCGN